MWKPEPWRDPPPFAPRCTFRTLGPSSLDRNQTSQPSRNLHPSEDRKLDHPGTASLEPKALSQRNPSSLVTEKPPPPGLCPAPREGQPRRPSSAPVRLLGQTTARPPRAQHDGHRHAGSPRDPRGRAGAQLTVGEDWEPSGTEALGQGDNYPRCLGLAGNVPGRFL